MNKSLDDVVRHFRSLGRLGPDEISEMEVHVEAMKLAISRNQMIDRIAKARMPLTDDLHKKIDAETDRLYHIARQELLAKR